MKKISLLACPFCGGAARLQRQYHNPAEMITTFVEGDIKRALPPVRIGFSAECKKCFSVGGLGETQDEAAALWNSRTPPGGEEAGNAS